MKKNYKRITPGWTWSIFGGWRWSEWGEGRYRFVFNTYYRYPKTFNEIRQNESAKLDGHKVRWKRSKRGLPTVWDDPSVSREYGRSWKDYTKHRKQYMLKLKG